MATLLAHLRVAKQEQQEQLRLKVCSSARQQEHDAHHHQAWDEPRRLQRLHVQLAVTPIEFGNLIPGVQAYHTSVLVNGTEYSFGIDGLDVCTGPESHEPFETETAETEIVSLGVVYGDEGAILGCLGEHFADGTYDLLRKNCNTFTDCVLRFLLGEGLAPQYCELDDFARRMDRHMGLVQLLSVGIYTPNRLASTFNRDQVQRKVQRYRHRVGFMTIAPEHFSAL